MTTKSQSENRLKKSKRKVLFYSHFYPKNSRWFYVWCTVTGRTEVFGPPCLSLHKGISSRSQPVVFFFLVAFVLMTLVEPADYVFFVPLQA
jgi:hypothetical protein